MKLKSLSTKNLRTAGLVAILSITSAGTISAQQAPKVVVAEATMTTVTASETFNGRNVSLQKVELLARVNGFVEKRGFHEGGRVEKGAVLYELEDDSYQFSLNQTEAAIDAAKAVQDLAKIERDRQAQLVSNGNAAQAVLDKAEAELASVTAQLENAHAVRDQAELTLSYTHVTAPFAGRVGLARADVGALVSLDTGSLVTLVATDPMSVEFSVTERAFLLAETRAREARNNNVAQVNLVLADGSIYGEEGEINFVDVQVDQNTDTVLLRAVFPNPDEKLRDGAIVSVVMSTANPEPMLTIPQQAVQRDLVGSYVLVVDPEGLAEVRRVRVGRMSEGLLPVLDGLKEGELVITEGVNKVRPGSSVDAALAGQE
jgi:membrane fusion protein (multidrug efflux system)